MSSSYNPLTPNPEINSLLNEVQLGAQAILGTHFVGMYLDGSLASGDFDADSDIDFVIVTEIDIMGDLFAALQAMHERIATIDSVWAIKLDGSYVSLRGLRHYDPAHALHPNLERGVGERLKIVEHDNHWDVHRHILRERGITIVGPIPRSLIDPVPPDNLRHAALKILRKWIAPILDHPDRISSRGYQSYIVLSLCRILYTLEHGSVASKPVAARWAQATMNKRWVPLIERSWEGRHHPAAGASADEVNETLDFIRYALECSRQFGAPVASI